MHNLSRILPIALSVFLYSSISPVFADVPDEVQAVFVNNTCLDCHSGANPSGRLSLDDAAISETALVSVVANCSTNNTNLVEPGDPQNSVLYLKLANQNPGCGGVMPPGGNLISAADLNTIFDWIVAIGPAAQFGLFAMEMTAVDVNETDPQVVLTVNRQLGTQGSVMVDFSVETVAGDTAVSPTDYIAQTGTLVFAEGETSQEITIQLADDDVFEGTEVFSVSLSNAQGGAVLGGADQTKVSIIDNEFDDQPGTFFFSRTDYSVDEDATSFDVTIIRSFGAAGQVTVDLTSSDGTAIANTDYVAVNSTLVFDEGVRNQTISIMIMDDAVEEESETFMLQISNPSNGAVLGAPSNVTATINDNDGTDPDPDPNPNPDPDPDPDPTPTPEEEAAFEAAGSLAILNSMLMLLIFLRRKP